MSVTLLPPFKGYREQVAGVVYRYVICTKKHPERASGIEILLVGRGPEHGWPVEWWDFPGGGVDDKADNYEPILKGSSDEDDIWYEILHHAVACELTQELGMPAIDFGPPLYTGITRTVSFRSDSAKKFHDQYSEKRIWYLTVPFLGDDNEITYHDRVTRHCWAPLTSLVAAVRPETKKAAAKLAKINRQTFFTQYPRSYSLAELRLLASNNKTADEEMLEFAEKSGDSSLVAMMKRQPARKTGRGKQRNAP